MKLFLTSMGIHNQVLADELARLVSIPIEDVKVGFIPTAANIEQGDKGWFLRQISNLNKFGFNWVDIIDFADPEIDWEERLKKVDVVFIGGGNVFYLLDQARKKGFDKWLKFNVDSKVIVRASAGSILLTPTTKIADYAPGDDNLSGIQDFTAIGLVDFEISPHFNSQGMVEKCAKYTKNSQRSLYALDDESGISVNGNVLKVVSAGKWEMFN